MYLLSLYVTNTTLATDHPYTYLSKEKVELYKRVEVFFNRALNAGLVVKCEYTSSSKEELEKEYGFKLIEINRVIDEEAILNDEQYKLAKWLSKVTLSSFTACLNTMLPKYLKNTKKREKPVIVKRIHKNDINNLVLTPRQKDIYYLLEDKELLSEARKLSISIVNKLINLNAISIYEEERQLEDEEFKINGNAFLELNDEQKLAYDSFLNDNYRINYLYGVTGSGKTEVYLHLAKEFLSSGKQVLILVPEISLTPQMIDRVKERFTSVAFYHSELSNQERYEQYCRIKNNKVKIVVGTRSAIFLPFNNLGLIILDEENDSSYIQDNTPCYDTRRVAIKRIEDVKGKLLMASATPSLEYYSRALKGDIGFLKLTKRINNTLPSIEVVDLNKEIKKNHQYIFSNLLIDKIKERLSRHEQCIILLNRRGYSPIVKCGNCKTTLMCKDCDTALNYHKDEASLKCHQCGRVYHLPAKCPKCGHDDWIYYGFGTKRVEEEALKLFNGAKIARMDHDATLRKGSHQDILKRFENKEIDILIGTQMIAKGLDYPDVTLVGILNADASLLHQDYNSAKMTFDLLMQASGRSGRSLNKGEVVIQAFNTNHYVLNAVKKQDYDYFYRIEMNYRYQASYPPYRHLISLIISEQNEDKLNKLSLALKKSLDLTELKVYRSINLAKRIKEYRSRILVTGNDLRKMLVILDPLVRKFINDYSCRLKVEIDPLVLE